MEHIGVVLINYKSETATIQFVKKELGNLQEDFIVVVVNNGANDESTRILCDQLQASRIDDVKVRPIENDTYVIHSQENLGFANGNNIGAIFLKMHFNNKQILFSNTDIHICTKDAVKKMQETLANDESIGIIGPCVVGLDKKKQSPEPYMSFWNRYVTKSFGYHFISKEKTNRLLRLDYAENAKEGIVDKVMGSFFMVNAKYFYDVDMMDPHTFLYYEELILTERMRNIGKSVYYLPSVTVVHEHGVTIKKFNSYLKMEKFNLQSGIYYYRHYKKTPWVIILIGAFLYRLFNYYVAFKNK